MPYTLFEKDIKAGRLRIVGSEYSQETNIIMAWHRGKIGEAKFWCLRQIPQLFNSDHYSFQLS